MHTLLKTKLRKRHKIARSNAGACLMAVILVIMYIFFQAHFSHIRPATCQNMKSEIFPPFASLRENCRPLNTPWTKIETFLTAAARRGVFLLLPQPVFRRRQSVSRYANTTSLVWRWRDWGEGTMCYIKNGRQMTVLFPLRLPCSLSPIVLNQINYPKGSAL